MRAGVGWVDPMGAVDKGSIVERCRTRGCRVACSVRRVRCKFFLGPVQLGVARPVVCSVIVDTVRTRRPLRVWCGHSVFAAGALTSASARPRLSAS